MLQVRGVSHAFAERPVLDDVTFGVPSGGLTGRRLTLREVLPERG